jgi:hypothetical protein
MGVTVVLPGMVLWAEDTPVPVAVGAEAVGVAEATAIIDMAGMAVFSVGCSITRTTGMRCAAHPMDRGADRTAAGVDHRVDMGPVVMGRQDTDRAGMVRPVMPRTVAQAARAADGRAMRRVPSTAALVAATDPSSVVERYPRAR